MKLFGVKRKYYTIEETREILGCTRSWVHQKINDGTFTTSTARQRGRKRTLIWAEDVDSYIEMKLMEGV